MSTTEYGEDPDVPEGSSVDPIIAQPLAGQAPSQGIPVCTDIGNISHRYAPHLL